MQTVACFGDSLIYGFLLARVYRGLPKLKNSLEINS